MSDETPGAGQSAVPREGLLAPKPAPVRITQIAGGQYVVTSPGANAVTAYGAPQISGGSSQGIPHIINISPTRVSQQTSQLRPSQTSQSIVKALTNTSTKATKAASHVRVQLFHDAATASTTAAAPSAAARTTKRILSTSPPERKDVFGTKLQRVINHHLVRSKLVREKYNEKLLEHYHLNMGCNLLDLYQLAKRPKTLQYMQYLNENSIELKDAHEASAAAAAAVASGSVSTTPPIPTATAVSSLPGMATNMSTSTATTTSTTYSSNSANVCSPAVKSLPEASSAVTTTSASTAVPPTSLPAQAPPNPEQVVEKAKHEAIIVQRINDLQKEGLWTEKRLPKVAEMPRIKTHWDYMLEEMVWLAADFAQERKWKKAAARKCSRMVQKYFQDKAQAAQKAERAHELHIRRVAAFVAKEIKSFWGNAEKLVEFKQHTRLEEKRKQALDQHLSFIVDQTEKYSQLLAEGMNKPLQEQLGAGGSNPPSAVNSDDEFRPDVENSTDDEETIAQEEAQDEGEKSEEIAALQRESLMDFNDFLSELPKDYLQHREQIRLSASSDSLDESDGPEDDSPRTASSASSRSKTKPAAAVAADADKDDDFTAGSSDEEDDENTIQEQEQAEGEQDHTAELCHLQEEAEMDIEELRRMYAQPQSPPLLDDSSNMSAPLADDVDVDIDVEVDADTTDDEAKADAVDEEEEEDDDLLSEQSDDEDDYMSDDSVGNVDGNAAAGELTAGAEIGLKSLLEGAEIKTDPKNDLINDAAAIAESIQPKGNTLSSQSVVTPIPFLLKFTLREYQHIGLDWLVTMFERKLNGILADEMGLGKTIQTIALLAHLACEKGNWGPHLIVVPTSVMLNWEMECKKWCPGFKILTYYGTQKERKLKRTGWTKPNAFHVCITSYKLVIQDHQSFRRKKWKYLILDEAQNIKNFKSQRWQLLLNFKTQQRLLLTGTPLQNNLMELWSLMHFLMPNVFQSHREFKEWFSNPVTGMIEGNSEYNENIIKRLHKVLRPFLLRRLKCEVEKQMPKKFEHVIMCRLSKRQRFLYDDYMSRTKTKETLATGNLLSVINVLMQLRKVCNHPNLFESRPTISPFQCDGIVQHVPALVYSALEYDVWKHIDLTTLGLNLLYLEFRIGAYQSYRVRQLKATKKLIEVISTAPKPTICPPSRLTLKVHRKPINKTPTVRDELKTLQTTSGQKVKLIQHPGGIKAVQITPASSSQTGGAINLSNVLTPSVPSYAQLVETLTGKHILFTPTCNINTHSIGITGTTTVMTSSGQKLTLLPKQSIAAAATTGNGSSALPNNQTTAAAIAKAVVKVQLTSLPSGGSSSPIPKDNINVDVAPAPRKPIDPKFIERLYMQTSNANNSKPDGRYYNQNDSSSNGDGVDVEARRKAKWDQLARFNELRCTGEPIYGLDLLDSIAKIVERASAQSTMVRWSSGGRVCREIQLARNELHTPAALQSAIYTPVKMIDTLKSLFERYIVYVPSAYAPEPEMQVWHPSPSTYWGRMRARREFALQMSEPAAPLHHIASSMITQFPHARLIQYDCGKLQTLDRLLRLLKNDSHRVLIFTQMTKMLDVLEAFLNFHGHIYLRLDGSTKIDQRQILMERFNGDPKIFAFILSTRSGGVGVNLTGADTVIFYDSDWNPTMDAQAQDRCHRIGQTRDVHIYRLVSEMTIEENILKKANQKRLLGDLAIEGGNFTTAYFKSSTIQDLFNIDANETAATRMSGVVETSVEHEERQQAATSSSSSSGAVEQTTAMGALESALASAEDDQDVLAARTAKAEAVAELAEFDENIPLDDKDEKEKDEREKEPEMSKAEQEVVNLMQQLTPIERYAMRFIEETESAWSVEQLAAAEREIEERKRVWEENRIATIREEEERRARELEEENELLTFSREDATNQIWVSQNTNEQMPMWGPPTPPGQHGDVYIDHTMAFLYDTQRVMPETQLPAVYVKKEAKRTRAEAGLVDSRRPPSKAHKRDDVALPPKSIFNNLSLGVKIRRDQRIRYRGLMRAQLASSSSSSAMIAAASSSSAAAAAAAAMAAAAAAAAAPPGVKYTVSKPHLEQPGHNWMIHEDAAILKVVQRYQGLGVPLMLACAGHAPNWDFVADYVNTIACTYRSAKQCRNRYESVLVPREEGKQLVDSSPRKKKQKSSASAAAALGIDGLPPYKYAQTAHSKGHRSTSQLYLQDNNGAFNTLMSKRYDALESVTARKPKSAPTTAASGAGVALKNPKHEGILSEHGIDLDRPVSAVDIAAKRAERNREKKILPEHQLSMQKHLQLIRQVQAAAQQQQQQQQQQQSAAAAIAAAQAQHAAGNSPSSSSVGAAAQIAIQQQQQQQVQAVVHAVQVTTMQTVVNSAVATTATPSTPPNAARMSRIVASPLQANASVVSVSGIGAGQQLQAQRLIVSSGGPTKATVVGAGTVTAKALSAAQLQMLRNATLKQQAHMRLQSAAVATATTGVTQAPLKASAATVVAIPGQPAAVQVQLTQASARAHIIKGGAVAVGNKQVTRPLTESEVAHLFKLKSQKMAAAAAAAAAGGVGGGGAGGGQVTTISSPQVYAQALQAASSSSGQMATIVKTVSTSGVTQTVLGTPVKALPQGVKTPQQLRALQLQQLMAQKKRMQPQKIAGIAQVTGKGGVAATQLIVSPKPLASALTVQQFQQVMRSPLGVPQGPVVLATKGGASRMIPVNATAGPVAKSPTIQVVASPSSGLSTAIRPPTSTAALAAASLAGFKVQQQQQQAAILSQVSAVLGQNVRQGCASPVRIQAAAGSASVAVQQAQASTTSSPGGLQASPTVTAAVDKPPTDNAV